MSAVQALVEEDDALTFGQILRFELNKRGWRQHTLAEEVGLSRATINSLINNRDAVVSADVAMRLARTFGRPPDFWMRKQFSSTDLHERGGEDRSSSADAGYGRLTDVGIKMAIAAGEISVTPFSEILVKPAALDLRVGPDMIISDGGKVDLGAQAYWLGAKESVLLKTLETVSLSRRIAGNIGGMARHARKFIQYGLGFEIDPGFSGHLSFMVTNMGSEPYRIKAEMPIITASFYRLAEESRTLYRSKDAVVQERPAALTGNKVGEDILQAFREKSQAESQPGVYTYRIDGTNFALKYATDLRKESDFKILFGLYLSEIQAITNDLKAVAGKPEEEERVGRPLDGLWNFVWKISINREALLLLAPRLRGALQDEKIDFAGWLADLKAPLGAATCTLGDQSDRLGITPFEFLLLVFKNSSYPKAVF